LTFDTLKYQDFDVNQRNPREMLMNDLIAFYKKQPRWVCWEERGGRKLPIDPKTGRMAKSDDAVTWGTHAQANGRSERVGIMLGMVCENMKIKGKDLGGWTLCGLDLDGCLKDDGGVIPEAREVIDRFKSYTEVSPSGKGVHILFALGNGAVARLREDFGIMHRKSFAVGPHQEMSLDLSNRYYTVTGEMFNQNPIDDVKPGAVEWFIRDAGPNFQKRNYKVNGQQYQRDESKSGYARRFFKRCYRKRMSYEEAIREIKRDEGRAGDWARLSSTDERQFKRAWENAEKAIELGESTSENSLRYMVTTRASEIELESITWLWKEYIALGELTIIAGESDGGKTTLIIDITARVTRGLMMPDKSGKAPKGDVLFMSAEDKPSHTLVPRLIAAGADLGKVHFVKMSDGSMVSLATDLKALELLITKKVRLIVIDPITAYMGHGKLDTFRSSDVRSVLSPLSDLIGKYGISVIMISHFSKNSKGNALHRVLDSQAYTAASRHVYFVAPDPMIEDRMMFYRGRNAISIKRKGQGMGYTIENINLGNGIRAARIEWDDDPITLVGNEKEGSESASATRGSAREFLKAHCQGLGMEYEELMKQKDGYSISTSTLYRARNELNIRTINKLGKVFWVMPG
jgi:hypothetical protein